MNLEKKQRAAGSAGALQEAPSGNHMAGKLAAPGRFAAGMAWCVQKSAVPQRSLKLLDPEGLL